MVQNPDIRELARLDRVLSPRRDSPVAGRPLVNLSFAIDYALSGLDVTGVPRHQPGVAHRLRVAAVRRRSPHAGAAVDAAAGALPTRPTWRWPCAVVWGVHPLTTEVVDYLSQRTESMMACFLLLTLYAAIRLGCRTGDLRSSPAWPARCARRRLRSRRCSSRCTTACSSTARGARPRGHGRRSTWAWRRRGWCSRGW